MSRSRRKNPVCGLTLCQSEKVDKIIWHQKMRAIMRHRLHNADPDTIAMPVDNDAGSIWIFGKDGKQRFDPREWPKLMRK